MNIKNNILTTSQLSIGYSDKKNVNTIASAINLSLEKGKLIALIGANGIGKSTLAINIFKNFAIGGYKGVIYSLEMSKNEVINKIEVNFHENILHKSTFIHDDIKTIMFFIDFKT